MIRSKLFGVSAILALMCSCSGDSGRVAGNAPSHQNDICAIFDQRPQWRDAVEVSAIRWGVPVSVQMAIIWRESSFRSDVRPPRQYALGAIPVGYASSAYGYAQAIDGTWDWYREETGRYRADRTNFADAVDFVGWYANKTRMMNGIDTHNAFHQYLAYHEGHRGYSRGAWQSKQWLQRAAAQVASQAAQYRQQINYC